MEAGKVGKGLAVVGLAVCLVGNLGIGAYQVQSNQKNDSKVNKFIDNQLEKQAKEEEKENTYQEDGYMVGESYEIRSTKAISDAYKSGDSSKLSAEDKETLEMATKIFEKETKGCKTNYEKEVAIYNWMYKNIRQNDGGRVVMPNSAANDFTPHGVLLGKKSVCVGYATTFRLFMNMMGLECHIVHNDYHSWDLVQLDDGEWYHTDIYSDVSCGSQYSNFNMTDGIAQDQHEWDKSALPEAKGTEYSYAVQNKKEVKDLYAVPELVKQAIKKKKPGVFCSFKTKLSEEDLKLADLMISGVESALYSVSEDGGNGISAYWYDTGKDNYVLGIYLSYYNEDGGEVDVDKKLQKKMNAAIKKAFGVDVSNSEGGMDDYSGNYEPEG